MTPTESTLKLLRAEGYLPQVVEQTVYGAASRAAQEPGKRPFRQVWKRDLFGIGDVLLQLEARSCP